MKNPERQSLKIGFVFDDTLDSDDGVAQYVKRLGSWLAGQGHSVSYLVGQSKSHAYNGSPLYPLAKNLPLRWGGNRLSIPFWSKADHIERLLEEKNFDVLHVQFPYSPFMAQRIINRASPRTAVVGTVHVFPGTWITRVGSRILKLIYAGSLGRFNKFVSVSSAAQKYARDNFGIESQIVPNTVDTSAFKVQKSPPSKVRRIVFLGRLVDRKGCKYLLKAFGQIAATRHDVELIIAGGGPKRRQLQRLARSYSISDRVHFLGHISEKQKPKLLGGADIACFPSLYGESFGIVLIEAMAAGAAVVLGGDNPGYRTVLGDQPRLLIDPKRTSEFARRLNELLDNRAEVEGLSRWQKNEVSRYDLDNVGRELVKVYASAIAKAGQSGHN